MRKKIRILYIIDSFCGIGGTERHLYYLLTHLNRDKFKPYLVVFDLKKNDLIDKLQKTGEPLYHIPVNREYTLNALHKAFSLAAIIKKEKINIVQTYHMKSDTYGSLIAHFSGIKHIVSSKRDTGDLKKNFHFTIHKICNRYIGNFIFAANAVRREICKKEKIENKHIKVIYNGINSKQFAPPDREMAMKARKKIDFTVKDFVIGTVAWLRPEKGHWVLFEAIKSVREKIPNIKLIVVGGGYLYEHYQNFIENNGLSKHVFLTGRTNDVKSYLNTFDIACLVPIANEGFSNSILEKMAMGLPLIVTDVGGNTEAVINGYNGIVIRPGDIKSLAQGIITLYKDNEKRITMGKRSRQLAVDKFSMEKMISQHEEFYESIMGIPLA